MIDRICRPWEPVQFTHEEGRRRGQKKEEGRKEGTSKKEVSE
jgi:hypothetical protein